MMGANHLANVQWDLQVLGVKKKMVNAHQILVKMVGHVFQVIPVKSIANVRRITVERTVNKKVSKMKVKIAGTNVEKKMALAQVFAEMDFVVDGEAIGLMEVAMVN